MTLEERLKYLGTKQQQIAQVMYQAMGSAIESIEQEGTIEEFTLSDYFFLCTLSLADIHVNFFSRMAVLDEKRKNDILAYAKGRAIDDIRSIVEANLDLTVADLEKSVLAEMAEEPT